MKKKSRIIIYEIQQLNIRWYTTIYTHPYRRHLNAEWNLIRAHADVCIQRSASIQFIQICFLLIKKLGKWVVEHWTYAQCPKVKEANHWASWANYHIVFVLLDAIVYPFNRTQKLFGSLFNFHFDSFVVFCVERTIFSPWRLTKLLEFLFE